jgi:hypothetical protein
MKFERNPAGIIIDNSKTEHYIIKGDLIINYLNLFKHRVKVFEKNDIIYYGINLYINEK